jgi:hypothetical protein
MELMPKRLSREEKIRRAEIEKRVMEKYPISKGEIKCSVERGIMNQLRVNYRRKLEVETRSEKQEYE